MADGITCLNCNLVKDQSGSAHHLCPHNVDFSFQWKTTEDWAKIADECEYFVPRGDDYDPKCNAFMAWMGHESPWPSHEEMVSDHMVWLESIGRDKDGNLETKG
ncbi:MAG: hypothetical protein KAJ39_06435 [Gammaproteobacteria bacterium]|nr:hypothetical protein [Gammaproteobacteria bacterium]